PLRQHFESVHGEVKVAALQAAEETLEIVMDPANLPAQLARKHAGKVNLEASVLSGPGRVGKNERDSALLVGGPAQTAERRDARGARRGCGTLASRPSLLTSRLGRGDCRTNQEDKKAYPARQSEQPLQYIPAEPDLESQKRITDIRIEQHDQ